MLCAPRFTKFKNIKPGGCFAPQLMSLRGPNYPLLKYCKKFISRKTCLYIYQGGLNASQANLKKGPANIQDFIIKM